MAQLQANPWLFLPADQATTVGITSIVNQVDSILLTASGAHGFATNYTPISIQGTTSYNGGYRIIAIPSATTLLLKNRAQNYTAANGGALGNLLSVAYIGGNIRAEQILWNNPTASTSLLLTDLAGNVIWNPSSGTAATTYVYGKIYYIANGLVVNTLGSGSVQITVN